jgi:hypothetical protein
MLSFSTKRTRQVILNEIVSTLEFIEYLKYEALVPVQNIIKREEAKKIKLVAQLETIER